MQEFSFVSIDADSIIEADSILKLVKPFLEERDHKVIGTGGVIRIVNSCDVESGHIERYMSRKIYYHAFRYLNIQEPFCWAGWPESA